jgi:hypothetical protein
LQPPGRDQLGARLALGRTQKVAGEAACSPALLKAYFCQEKRWASAMRLRYLASADIQTVTVREHPMMTHVKNGQWRLVDCYGHLEK